MRRFLMIALGLGLLSACTPADEQYCRAYGVGGTPEFGKCMGYYHKQETLFNSDRGECSMRADETYPQSLYDTGGYAPVLGGPYYGGPFSSPGGYAFVEPDYRRNAQVDQLRMRIIGPCMQAKGWNSAKTWQAGKHNPVRVTPKAAAVPARKTVVVEPEDPAPSSLNSLPWLQ